MIQWTHSVSATALILFAIACTVEADTVIRDLDYIDDAVYADKKDRLDLFIPEGEGPFPVVVFVHGGGLLRGDKSGSEHIGHAFAAHGFLVANVNHRLSPGVSHPTHIQDFAASVAWVKRNIAKHGGDPDAVFIIGHSAGAYLVGLLATDSRYLNAHGLDLSDLAGAIPISGFFHVERLAPGRPKSVWGESEETWIDASPARHVSKDAPPLLALYADGDVPERRKESEDFASELRDAGQTAASTKQIDNRTHITIWSRIAPDDPTVKAAVAFMQSVIQSEGSRPK